MVSNMRTRVVARFPFSPSWSHLYEMCSVLYTFVIMREWEASLSVAECASVLCLALDRYGRLDLCVSVMRSTLLRDVMVTVD